MGITSVEEQLKEQIKTNNTLLREILEQMIVIKSYIKPNNLANKLLENIRKEIPVKTGKDNQIAFTINTIQKDNNPTTKEILEQLSQEWNSLSESNKYGISVCDEEGTYHELIFTRNMWEKIIQGIKHSL